jgi:hypothetical protein
MVTADGTNNLVTTWTGRPAYLNSVASLALESANLHFPSPQAWFYLPHHEEDKDEDIKRGILLNVHWCPQMSPPNNSRGTT